MLKCDLKYRIYFEVINTENYTLNYIEKCIFGHH